MALIINGQEVEATKGMTVLDGLSIPDFQRAKGITQIANIRMKQIISVITTKGTV